MSRQSGNRKSRRNQLKASHQKNWLIGRYAVLETLRSAKWPIVELFVTGDIEHRVEIDELLSGTAITVRVVTADRLTELCHSSHHQGLAARMGEFPYQSMEWLLAEVAANSADSVKPLVVICDRIQDTFNFGAILRTCDAMKAMAVLVGESEQAIVTPQVSRSSSGAVNHVEIVQVEDLHAAVAALSECGLQIVSASEHGSAELWTGSLGGPVGLVVGSEAQGVSQQLLVASNLVLKIPMLGHVGSLNVAVAAGIMLYEIRRQQLATV